MPRWERRCRLARDAVEAAPERTALDLDDEEAAETKLVELFQVRRAQRSDALDHCVCQLHRHPRLPRDVLGQLPRDVLPHVMSNAATAAATKSRQVVIHAWLEP